MSFLHFLLYILTYYLSSNLSSTVFNNDTNDTNNTNNVYDIYDDNINYYIDSIPISNKRSFIDLNNNIYIF